VTPTWFISFLFFSFWDRFSKYIGGRDCLCGVCMSLESSLLSLFFNLCNCAELSPPFLASPPSFSQSSQVAQWAFYYLFSSYLIFSISGYLFCCSYRRSNSFKPLVSYSSFIISFQFHTISFIFAVKITFCWNCFYRTTNFLFDICTNSPTIFRYFRARTSSV
jgi:hypothetical protein